MKTLMIAATILSIAVSGSAIAKSAAGNDKMKACSAQWSDMKTSGQAKGMKYKDFSKTCLAGASTTTTSTTTTAPVVKTAPVAKVAPPAPAPAAVAPTPAVKPAPMMTTTTTHHVSTSSSSSTTLPAGATAKCKDGTYSLSKTHSGSCSHHGGVANFL